MPSDYLIDPDEWYLTAKPEGALRFNEGKPQALRYNSGKPELSYILDFPRAVEALCRVMEHGHSGKYPRDNWKKGGKPDTEYFDSALRHIYKDRNGEPFDAESGQLHIAHAIWNLMVLLEKNRKFSKDSFKESGTKGTKCFPT